MKSIIVGTAGHIDHGKTALVKALTGIDADRLDEEKRRGITIDLGFAHMDLPTANGETLRLGFVDVPGHERFVRNMLAGVGGIDAVLLVIAADESIKPQTREHLDILRLLGVQRGITVLTKADTVDAETLEVVRLEVEDFLRGTFLQTPKSPIVAVSAITGAGLDDLKRALISAATEMRQRDSQALARLPIDRVFTMKGFGTVVTGTLVAGSIHREQELEVLPTGQRVRVRGVQVHGSATDLAVAGQRTALNLAGVSTDDLARGMTLVPPATFNTTRTVDVELQLLASAPRPIKNRARVHFHSNTMETGADIMLLGEKNLPPGSEAFARIKLQQPTLLLPGDHFIIREFSPVVTIGGGIVLDAAPLKRSAQALDFLSLAKTGGTEEIVNARIARHDTAGISIPALIAETGLARSALEKILSESVRQRKFIRVGEILIQQTSFETIGQTLLAAVEKFHKSNPLLPGIGREQLREQANAPSEIFGAVLADFARTKKLEIAGEIVRIPGRGVSMKDEEAEAKSNIEAAFVTAGLKVPALYEVLAALKVDKARAQKIVTLLLRDKVLIKVSDELVFHRNALEGLRQLVAAQKAISRKIDVAKFKELTGVSRKYAIPLLEYLDRERLTRRVGDFREIL